jgi:16S rRNA processing protein RimM
MNKDDFFYLGRILKTHGNKGHLLVLLDVDDPGEYTDIESVYLDLQGERIPFFIGEIELRQNRKAIVRFEDVNSIEDAAVYKGVDMYLPARSLPALDEEQFYFHEIIGFAVTDSKFGAIGTLEEVIELPHQSLFRINWNSKEILVPLVDEFITSIDRENRMILIEAPEGLIDIYI